MYFSLWRGLMITFCAILPQFLCAQILTSNGATISVLNGGTLHANGGVSLTNNTSVTNEGTIRITKNATSPIPGTFSIGNGCNVSGAGDYYVEQDWNNDGNFVSANSAVFLYGNTQQWITSTNGTVTEFNYLGLSGNGTGVDRRKTLLGVDARISTTGTLDLSDRELFTQNNDMVILNTNGNAVINSLVFGDEGFVSSDVNGNLIRHTNAATDYYFPVGSSNGTRRFRPVNIRPYNANANTFDVRLDNVSADVYGYLLTQHDADLSTLNPLFFHSIEQSSGSSNADIEIAYDAADDGNWNTIAHWDNGSAIWNSLAPTGPSTFGNYNSQVKSGWTFPDPYLPYVLANSEQVLDIPNVFTPNNDGSNDTYLVTGKGFTDYSIVIVNRWGNTVYQSDDITVGWDGTSDGKPCNDGVYFYIIRAKSGENEIVKHGNLTLVNN